MRRPQPRARPRDGRKYRVLGRDQAGRLREVLAQPAEPAVSVNENAVSRATGCRGVRGLPDGELHLRIAEEVRRVRVIGDGHGRARRKAVRPRHLRCARAGSQESMQWLLSDASAITWWTTPTAVADHDPMPFRADGVRRRRGKAARDGNGRTILFSVPSSTAVVASSRWSWKALLTTTSRAGFAVERSRRARKSPRIGCRRTLKAGARPVVRARVREVVGDLHDVGELGLGRDVLAVDAAIAEETSRSRPGRTRRCTGSAVRTLGAALSLAHVPAELRPCLRRS